MNAKRFFTFCVVLVLVCSCAWAYPKKASSEDSSPVTPEEVEQLWQEVIETSTNPSTADYEMISKNLRALATELNSSFLKTKSGLSQISSEIQTVADDAEIAAQVSDEAIKALEHEVMRFKYFAMAGATIGFKEGLPNLSPSVTAGVKFPCGLIASVGAQYNLVQVIKTEDKPVFKDLGIAFDWTPSIDRLSVNISVGWEW